MKGPLLNQHLREHAERNLGALVIAIEFTLISVMVGVILFPLMDHATPILRDLKFEYMLYILSGLVLILYIWTEVITHSLSFIGWPIDIIHNLLYIVFAMVLAVQMHFLQEPLGWYAMTFLSALVAAAISYYDQQVIAGRMHGATGASATLFQAAHTRQKWLVRISPVTVLNALVQVALVFFLPVLFIEYRAHLILIVLQIFGFLFLMRRTIRAFIAERELIVQKSIQELEEESTSWHH
ncbi:MAG: hypothetical protein HY741_17475 [Chloroflexi bacterium]|nr:hypothetical protein [Chloroflexota bacterium]